MLKKILLIGLTILLFSCNMNTTDQALIGTWRNEYNDYSWEEMIFRDETFIINGSDYNGNYSFSGVYSYTTTDLTLYLGDYYYIFEYEISGSNLIISYPDGDQVYTRQ